MTLAEKMNTLVEHVVRHDVWHIGPVVITSTVVHTWIVMAILFALLFWLRRGLSEKATITGRQAFLEVVVEAFYALIDPILGREGRRFAFLIGGYFIFIMFMNLSWFIPEFIPPTTDVMTTAALAIIAMLFVWGAGIREHGVGGFLHHFVEPAAYMAPLNVVEQLVRPFSLAVRLFGNLFGGKMVVLVFGTLVALLLPVPIMGLEVLFGTIQAFVFALLVTTYLQGALHGH